MSFRGSSFIYIKQQVKRTMFDFYTKDLESKQSLGEDLNSIQYDRILDLENETNSYGLLLQNHSTTLTKLTGTLYFSTISILAYFNPFLTNERPLCYHLDESIFMVRSTRSDFEFVLYFIEFLKANRIVPFGTSHSAALHLTNMKIRS